MTAARLAVPPAGFRLLSKQLLQQQRLAVSFRRYASSTSTTPGARPPPPKPRVLEQPDKFRPPSHPARLRSKPRYSGPPLSEHEREAQRKRHYPHMMPPEGTFMHWFLTDRTIHLVITMSVLIFLVVGAWFQSFLHNTQYRDLLPPNSMFFSHPLQFLGRWWQVYDMHVAYESAQTAQRRKALADDVAKRAAYRKAHGIEEAEKSRFGGWTARENIDTQKNTPQGLLENSSAAQEETSNLAGQGANTVAQEQPFVAFDGTVQPARKKWFGIF